MDMSPGVFILPEINMEALNYLLGALALLSGAKAIHLFTLARREHFETKAFRFINRNLLR